MRYILLIIAILVANIAVCQNNNSTMKLDSDSWDFGKIKETDGIVKHTFTFTNTGNKPFVIENVSVSCGCTTPKFSKAPVMPNAQGTIEITFDPKDRPGVFSKHIYVTSNKRNNQNVITIKGEVIARPRTIEEDYPFNVGATGLKVSDLERNFGYVAQGEVKSMTIAYANTSGKRMELIVKSFLPSNKESVSTTYNIEAGERSDITLSCDLRNQTIFGMRKYDVELYINGVLSSRKLSATMVGIDNFKNVDRATAPSTKIDKVFHHFGDVTQNDIVTEKFTITNSGKSTLKISSCKSDEAINCTLKAGDTVAPGKSLTFTISVATAKYNKGRLFTSVYVTMNDPLRPLREFRLVADIK